MMTSTLRLPLAVCIALLLVSRPAAQEPTSPLDEEGRMVQFSRDIAPLLAARCLECHNEKNAKNDFRVDSAESISYYIEAGDGAASSLLVDYLLSEDPDMLMPPTSHGGPLSAAELALIRVWIDEGAHWPDDGVVGAFGQPSEGVVQESVAPVAVRSLLARLWVFQGYFHPAVVHFPIALLLVGGLFVVISWRYPHVGNQVAIVCLALGTVSALVASAMGWAFAAQRGYGSWSRVDVESEIFWHRWSALFVTSLAVLLSAIAIAAYKKSHSRLHVIWKVGLLGLAAMIGLVGHQGGELTYGKSHYQQAFEVLWGAPPVPVGVDPSPDIEPPDGVGQPGGE